MTSRRLPSFHRRRLSLSNARSGARATITPVRTRAATIALGAAAPPARAGRKRARDPPTRRKISMEPADKENRAPELPAPTVRYRDAQGRLTQILHFGESARSIFMLEKPSERRLRLVAALKDAPRSVERWLALLRCPLPAGAGKYSQLRLLRRAVTCVDSAEARDSEGYTEMCIMLAKLSDTEAGVRQSFQEMRKRRVGERQPLLYEEEAAFEYDAGNREAAEEILERGVDNDAYTPAQKDELLKRVVAGRAGWVAAFSGSPQEQKVLALRARMEAYRKKQEDMLAEPPQSEEKFVTTPRHATTPVHTSFVPADTTPVNRARDGLTSAPTHSSPNATPVSQTRTGVGFSTVSKAPRNGSKSPVLTTPSLPTRPNLKSQSTSRKTHHAPSRFRTLGGPPLRVIASGGPQSDDEEDEDDSVKGNQVTQSKLSKPMSPIKEPKEVTHKSPVIKTEPKAKLKVDIGDISHILKWNPKKKDIPTSSKDIRDSLDPSLKAPSACTTSTTSLAKMSPKKGIKGVPVPPTIGTGMVLPPRKITEQAKPTNPVMTNKFSAPDHLPSAVEQGASESKADTALGTRVLVGSDISRALDHYRSPKRQQLDPSVAAANNCADMGSPSSVSSSSSPPVAAMSSASSRDALESLTSRVVVKGKRYIKLEQIGSGGSSKVYRMLGPDLKIYALKKIKLKKLDAQTIAQYTNEIDLLEKLQGNPHIIKLIAAEQDLKQRQINVIMEHGEIDLSERLRDLKGRMDDNLLRVIWTQMLQAVEAIHSKRIIHGDLKPANFLFVNGALKLIDFGIAKAISNDTTNIVRDSQIGTVNYMSPEAIQGNTQPNGQRDPQGKMKVGCASDIWSLGCILYQIVYLKPPFADAHSIIDKFRCIIDPSVPIPFPDVGNKDLEDVLRSCLQRDHRLRPPINGEGGLLKHPFLRSGGSVSSAPTVTIENAPQLLSQLGDLLRSRGVATSRVNMFMTIGENGLRNSSSEGSQTHRYLYNTQERRTDI